MGRRATVTVLIVSHPPQLQLGWGYGLRFGMVCVPQRSYETLAGYPSHRPVRLETKSRHPIHNEVDNVNTDSNKRRGSSNYSFISTVIALEQSRTGNWL